MLLFTATALINITNLLRLLWLCQFQRWKPSYVQKSIDVIFYREKKRVEMSKRRENVAVKGL